MWVGCWKRCSDGSVTDWRHSIVAEGQVVAIVSRKSTSSNAVYYPLEDNQGQRLDADRCRRHEPGAPEL